jgi:hypothetical protein
MWCMISGSFFRRRRLHPLCSGGKDGLLSHALHAGFFLRIMLLTHKKSWTSTMLSTMADLSILRKSKNRLASKPALPTRVLNSTLKRGLKLRLAFRKPHAKTTKCKNNRVATESSTDSELMSKGNCRSIHCCWQMAVNTFAFQKVSIRV